MTRLFYTSKLIGVAAFGAAQLLVLAGCDGADAATVAEVPDLNGIDQLEFSGDGDIDLRQGSAALTVHSDDADEIEITRDGKVLRIEVPRRVDGTPKFVLTLPQLTRMDLSGAARVHGNGWHFVDLQIEASGATKLILGGLQANVLHIESSGASDIKLAGTAVDHQVELSGASDYDAAALRADNVDVEASGASRVRVFAVTHLKLEGSGAGELEYGGSPTVEQDVSGIFRIKHTGG